MDETAVAGQELLGEFLLATGTQVEHGVRIRLVADIDPGIGSAPRVQEHDRRVVGVQGERGPHAAAHEIVERRQQLGTTHHLVAQGRA